MELYSFLNVSNLPSSYRKKQNKNLVQSRARPQQAVCVSAGSQKGEGVIVRVFLHWLCCVNSRLQIVALSKVPVVCWWAACSFLSEGVFNLTCSSGLQNWPGMCPPLPTEQQNWKNVSLSHTSAQTVPITRWHVCTIIYLPNKQENLLWSPDFWLLCYISC